MVFTKEQLQNVIVGTDDINRVEARESAWYQLPETNPFLCKLFKDVSERKAEELGDELIGAIILVNDWIEIRTFIPGALLCQVNKSGRVVQQRLTPQAVLFILQKRGLEADLEHFSPHDMRRTFVSDLFPAGTDIATVQSLAGHSNPAITARYDRRGEERKRRAAVQLEILGR